MTIPNGLHEFVVYAKRCCPSRQTTFVVNANNDEDAREKAFEVLYPNFRKIRNFWKQWEIVGVRKR